MIVYEETVDTFIGQLLITPGIMLLFSGFVVVINVVAIIQRYRINRTWKQEKKNVLHVCVVVSVFFFQAVLFRPFYRGVQLLFDDDTEYRCETGIIDDITHEMYSPRFSINESGEITHGCIVTINGRRYYSLDDKCISVGDKLFIQYLPNSKVIIYCVKENDSLCRTMKYT